MQRVSAQFVSRNFFDVVGLRPELGRAFLPEEDGAAAAGNVAVIGHDMPQRFTGLSLTDPAQLWLPLRSLPVLIRNEGDVYANGGWLRVVARLRPGATLSSATAEATALGERLSVNSGPPRDMPAAVRARFRRMTLAVEPLSGGLAPSSRTKAVPVLSLIVLVPLLVIVVAAANVANLLIARTLQRRKEFAVRRALGASRWQLVRQMLTETIILALLAGVVGVTVAS